MAKITSAKLKKIVDHIHNNSFIQLPSNGELLGNCTKFAKVLAKNILKASANTRFRPQDSEVISSGLYWPELDHLEQLLIHPSDREVFVLGVKEVQLGSLAEAKQYMEDNNIDLALVSIPTHLFVMVDTREGIKVADAQRGFVCDLEDWEDVLEETSGIPRRERNQNLTDLIDVRKIKDISETIANFEKHIREFLDISGLRNLFKHSVKGLAADDYYGRREMLLALLTNPKILKVISNTNNSQVLISGDQQYYLEEGQELEIPVGQWCMGRDRYGQASIYIGSENGILNPHASYSSVLEKCEGPIHLTLSSKELGYQIRRECSLVDFPEPKRMALDLTD